MKLCVEASLERLHRCVSLCTWSEAVRVTLPPKTKRNSLRPNRGRSQKPHIRKGYYAKATERTPHFEVTEVLTNPLKGNPSAATNRKGDHWGVRVTWGFFLASFRMITRGEWRRINSSRIQPFKRGNKRVQISFRYIFNHSMITDIAVCPGHFYSQALLVCTHNCALPFTISKALKWFIEPNHLDLNGHLANTDIKWSNEEAQWNL